MTYGKYKDLRDAAWRCLIDYKIRTLPVDVVGIARATGIRILKNSAANELKSGESGLSFFDGKKWFIIYDDTQSVGRCRFTIAHELGHILLGHTIEGGYVARASRIGAKPEVEKEADMFAARILCPACVLWALNLHTAEEIAAACNVSHAAAQFRAERMKLLYERNKFLTSPLEKKVLRNFKKYIRFMRSGRTDP